MWVVKVPGVVAMLLRSSDTVDFPEGTHDEHLKTIYVLINALPEVYKAEWPSGAHNPTC